MKNDPIFIHVGKGMLENPFHQKFSPETQEWSQFNTIYFWFCKFLTSILSQNHQAIKIATKQSLEIRHWCKNNQLGLFITEKWLNLNDLNNQNNLACFSRIILYCYFVVRTVRKEAINRLVLKKINSMNWLQNIDQNLSR